LERWVGLLLLVGCVESASVRCPDGSVCPDGTQCALVADATLCVAPDQIASCKNKMQLDECGTNQRCYDGVCLVAGCGNGRMDPEEACDDGNTVPGDGCASDCRSNETCGNGVVDGINSEQCDGGADGTSHDGCASNCSSEHAEWTLVGPLTTIASNAAVAYDAARDRVVMFGGDAQTWEWDGARWMLQTPAISPVARDDGAMAYDPVRKRVVLFGGSSFDDTWEWDGTRWELRSPATSPPGRRSHAMAFDPRRKRIVMFGGQSSLATPLGDTWAWDGDTWTPVASAVAPSPRFLAAMAYDFKHDVIVLFGGGTDSTSRSDETWELGAAGWIPRSPANVPPARTLPALAWDPRSQRIVMHSGATNMTDTWFWDGTNWTLHPDAGPFMSEPHAVTAMREGNVIVLDRGKTYRWDAGWTLVEDSATPPPVRFGAAGAADIAGRRIIIHGGTELNTATASTIVWTGTWQRFTNGVAGSSPGRVVSAAMAFDAARGEAVHFGGFNGSLNAATNETWVFTTSWTQRTPPAPLPAPRLDHVLVYDAARARTLLFGGTGFGDTWLWDGAQWTQAQPSASPSARSQAAAAYDPIRRVVVLFGGLASAPLNDTWEWDGTTWTRRMVAGPPARSGHGMAWDPARKRIVMFGGFTSMQTLNDQWEWDGVAWQPLATIAPVRARGNHVLVSGIGGAGVLAFGGSNSGGTAFNDLLLLRWNGDAADELCDGSDRDGDTLNRCDDGDCWLVCTSCGNGTCDRATESCSTCPTDCTCAAWCGDLSCDAGEQTSCPGDC
jgi:cysteine-rich repeat protein